METIQIPPSSGVVTVVGEGDDDSGWTIYPMLLWSGQIWLFDQRLRRSLCLELDPKSEQVQVTEESKAQLTGLRLLYILVLNLIAPGFNAAHILAQLQSQPYLCNKWFNTHIMQLLDSDNIFSSPSCMFEQGFAWRYIVERRNPSESLFLLQFVDLNHTLVCLNRDGFSVGSQTASSPVKRAATTQVPLGGQTQQRAVVGALIIKWNRDWIGISCHCRTHQQGWSPGLTGVDENSPVPGDLRL